jgi:hypothetical protein
MHFERRDIAPRRSQVVEGWLAAMAGSDLALLTDWLITAVDLPKPCPALYLFGPQGTGKSLLAHGLARIWTTDEPSTLGRVVSRDGEINARCPIVVSDIVAGHDELPDTVLAPAVSMRLVITANGDGGTLADVAGLARIRVRDEARVYLRAMSQAWLPQFVGGDEIAAHVLWLAR